MDKIDTPNTPQFISPKHRAYREAGHTVMSYLLLKGFTKKYVPLSRDAMLAGFSRVTIEGKHPKWSKITFKFESFMTVPQVLLAGYAAEMIKFNFAEEILSDDSKLLETAWSLLDGYISEYCWTNVPGGLNKFTDRFLQEIYAHVEGNLRLHWKSVERLADTLMDQKSLSKEKAFKVIEAEIPEDLIKKAKSELSRSPDEKLKEMF